MSHLTFAPDVGGGDVDAFLVHGVSQLALNVAAGVSQRHVSYLEVSRARPSREMTGRLAQVLGLTLVESNEFLLAAGFAPRYERRALDDKALACGHRALEALGAQALQRLFARRRIVDRGQGIDVGGRWPCSNAHVGAQDVGGDAGTDACN